MAFAIINQYTEQPGAMDTLRGCRGGAGHWARLPRILRPPVAYKDKGSSMRRSELQRERQAHACFMDSLGPLIR